MEKDSKKSIKSALKKYPNYRDRQKFSLKNKIEPEKKNSWLKNIVKRAAGKTIDAAASVMSAPSRAASSLKSRKGERKLTDKMMPKRYGGEEAMTLKESKDTYKGLRSRIRKSNYSGAREFAKKADIDYKNRIKK